MPSVKAFRLWQYRKIFLFARGSLSEGAGARSATEGVTSYGYYRYQTDIMIVCVILLVLMVQVFQTLGTAWATRSDKRLRK